MTTILSTMLFSALVAMVILGLVFLFVPDNPNPDSGPRQLTVKTALIMGTLLIIYLLATCSSPH